LEISDKIAERRVQCRRVDPETGEIYNTISKPPPEDSTFPEEDLEQFKKELEDYRTNFHAVFKALHRCAGGHSFSINTSESAKRVLDIVEELLMDEKPPPPSGGAPRSREEQGTESSLTSTQQGRAVSFAFSLLALYYRRGSDDKRSKRFSDVASHVLNKTAGDPPHSWLKQESALLLAAEKLLEVGATATAELVLEDEKQRHGESTEYLVSQAKLLRTKKQYAEAETALNLAGESIPETKMGREPLFLEIQRLLGHVHFEQENFDQAATAYEVYFEWLVGEAVASADPLACRRIVELYMKKKRFKEAKDISLIWCKFVPSVISWLHCGAACIRLGELDIARHVLVCANELDREHPKVWGLLAIISLRKGNVLLAKEALTQALRFGLNDSAVFVELATCSFKLGRLELAQFLAEKALKFEKNTANQDILTEIRKHRGYTQQELTKDT